MRLVLLRLAAILRKELITLLRDPRGRVSLFLPPLVQIVVFSYVATMEVRHVDIAVVDHDHGPFAREVVSRLQGAPTFESVRVLDDMVEARRLLDRQRALAILALPSSLSADVAAGRSADIELLLDGRRSNAAQIVAGYIGDIVQGAAADSPAVRPSMPRGEVAIVYWFNPTLEYRWFMLPNLVGMLGLTAAIVITGLSVARERELGTFDQTLVSPATPLEIAVGKLLPSIAVGLVQTTLFLLIVTLGFGVPFRGSLLLFYAAVVAFTAACAGVGLFVSSLARTQQQAFLGAFAVVLPFALLSGFATPVENMPIWLQVVTTVNPLRHMIVVMQGVFLKETSLRAVGGEIGTLVAIGAFTVSVAIALFRRRAT